MILSPDWELGGGEAIHCCWWFPLPINPTTAALMMMKVVLIVDHWTGGGVFDGGDYDDGDDDIDLLYHLIQQ